MIEEKEIGSPNELPINQRLLEESLKLKKEKKALKERLKKIEEKRDDVSKPVYQRVHQDYLNQLQTLADQLLEKKQDIDRELASLYETRDKVQGNLKNHKDALEEITFRHQLGEFSKEEFQKQGKMQEDKVTRFEQVLTAVQNNIRRYESLFEGEDFSPSTPPIAEVPLTVEEEVDEWEKEAAEAAAHEKTEGTESEWMMATKPNISSSFKPQITVLSGKENVGKIYVINGALTIGRSHTNQIILKDAKISRQHAEIKMQGKECVIIDLNSSNGTQVNGQKVHEHILAANDEIQVGDFVLQFQSL